MKVDIVAVTKNRTTQEILNLPIGIAIIAENKIQEAEQKFQNFPETSRKFEKHFIGTLQKNKVKKAVILFDCIQSVDNLELAKKINTEAAKLNKIQEIYIQINISEDTNKNGFLKSEIKDAISQIKKLPNLKLTGLMTILKNNLTSSDSLKYYCEMKILFNKINKTILKNEQLRHLSMGMSDDWEQAIAAGSNMLRIGRAIFEPIYEKNFLKYL